MPKISVIVPVYKSENTIKRCIDSLLNQTFDDFELILIDDGSPDKSGEICDNFAGKDTRVKVFHQNNSGVSAARNKGIDEARGQYVSFVDSDDYVSPDFLDKLFIALSNSDSDMSVCGYFSVQGNVEPVPKYHPFADCVITGIDEIAEKVMKRVVFVQDTTGLFSPWGKLFKLSIIEENSLRFDKEMSFGEDMLFVLSFIDNCKRISFIKDALYCYYESDSGLFGSYRPSFLNDIMRCYRNLTERAISMNLKDACLPLSVKYHYYIERHLKAGMMIEKSKYRFVFNTYKNKDVQNVFNVLVENSNDLIKKNNWCAYELRIPKLINNRFFILATLYSLYQYDGDNLFRRLKHFFRGD